MKKRAFACTLLLALPLNILAQKGGGGAAGGAAGAVSPSGSAGASVSGNVQASTPGSQSTIEPAGHIVNPNAPLGEQGITRSAPNPADGGAPAANSPATVTAGNSSNPSQPSAPQNAPAASAQPAPAANAPQRGDQALSPADQGMLVQIRASVYPAGVSIATAAPAANSSTAVGGSAQSSIGVNTAIAPGAGVSFILKDGLVRLVGTVPSIEERQRIEAAVARVPGVIRVYDALAVGGQANTGVTIVEGAGSARPLAPTSRPEPSASVQTNR